jgi:hypothetical protein
VPPILRKTIDSNNATGATSSQTTYEHCDGSPTARRCKLNGVALRAVTQFWPRNAALWAVARGAPNAAMDRDVIIKMVHQWVAMDWVRVAMGTVGFIASVRALSVPYTALEQPKPASLPVKLACGAGIAAVLAVAYFISKI